MAITAKAQITNPDDAVLELTVSATVGEWRTIMRELGHSYPARCFGNAVTSVIRDTVGRVSRATDEVNPR